MRNHLILLICLFTMCLQFVNAQAQDSSITIQKWEGSVEANFYFFKDDFLTLPVIRGDKDKLHLEARYNYEGEKTLSVWAGYNFSGGKKVEYFITPMIGLAVGESAGLAPGLEMTYTLHQFELYTESEYFIDPTETENSFFYNWTDLTWSPKDWLWVGISGQRTRLYETDVDIQRGLFLGGGIKDWELSGYYYNPGTDDQFFIAALSWSF